MPVDELETPPTALVAPLVAREGTGDAAAGLPRRILRVARGHAAVAGTVATSLAIFLLQAVQGALLARVLGPAGRGEYATAVFYTALLVQIGMMGTMPAIARRAAHHPGRLGGLRRACFRVGALTGLATMAVVVLLAWWVLPAEKHYLAPLCMVCALALPWEHVRLALVSIDHGSARFSRYNASQLFAAAVLPAMLWAAWTMGVTSSTKVALLTILVPVFGLGFRLALDRQHGYLGPASPSPRTLLKEGTPFALAVIASDLFCRLDMFLMLWLASLSVQGLFAAAVPAATLLMVAPQALMLFAFNAGARRDRPLTRRRLAVLGTALLVFQVLSMAAFAAVLEPLIVLVFGPSFRGAAPLAMLLLPGMVCEGCAVVADGYLRGRNQAAPGIRARLAGAVVMVLAAVVLFGRWREWAVPMAASAGHAACALCLAWAVVRDTWSKQHEPVVLEEDMPGIAVSEY